MALSSCCSSLENVFLSLIEKSICSNLLPEELTSNSLSPKCYPACGCQNRACETFSERFTSSMLSPGYNRTKENKVEVDLGLAIWVLCRMTIAKFHWFLPLPCTVGCYRKQSHWNYTYVYYWGSLWWKMWSSLTSCISFMLTLGRVFIRMVNPKKLHQDGWWLSYDNVLPFILLHLTFNI